MRPRGEVRQALADAAKALAMEAGAATWRDLTQRACVGVKVGRQTVENMVRAGELERRGCLHVEGSRRPLAMYAPPARSVQGAMNLDSVLRSWSRG